MPKVFLSYSHDSSEHAARVLALANQLRQDGLDAILDQYEGDPPEGWPRWMDRQILMADVVLLICTETYYKRVMGQELVGIGKGVKWEGNLIYQHIYQCDTEQLKFIPVLFADGRPEHIPTPLRSNTFYRLDSKEEYLKLYRRVTNQHKIPKPSLGTLRTFSALECRPLFPESENMNVGRTKNNQEQSFPSSVGETEEEKQEKPTEKNEFVYNGVRSKMELPIELNRNIVNFLTSLSYIYDSKGQLAFINSATLDPQLKSNIKFPGSSREFVDLLVPQLVEYGKLADGRYALEAILEAAKGHVGQDKRNFCDQLIQEYKDFEKNKERHIEEESNINTKNKRSESPQTHKPEKLPAYSPHFQNRDEQRKDLKDFLYGKDKTSQQLGNTVTVSGVPGIGKSALVSNVIEEGDKDQNKTIYIYKEKITFNEVFDRCLKRLGEDKQKALKKLREELQQAESNGLTDEHKEEKREELIQSFLNALDEKQYIIVLDNMEELIENSDIKHDTNLKKLIEKSLEGSHEVKFLITSYKKLNGDKYQRAVPLKGFEEFIDFFELFKNELRRWNREYDEESSKRIFERYKQVASIPLGVRFLAKMCSRRSNQQFEDELDKMFNSESPYPDWIKDAYSETEANSKRYYLGRLVASIFDPFRADKEDNRKIERIILEVLSIFEEGAFEDAIIFVLKEINKKANLGLPSFDERKEKLQELNGNDEVDLIDINDVIKFEHDMYRRYAYYHLIKEENERFPEFTLDKLENLVGLYYKTEAKKEAAHKAPPKQWCCKKHLQAIRHFIKAKKYDKAVKYLNNPVEKSFPSILEYLQKWGEYKEISDLLEYIPIQKLSDSNLQQNVLIWLGIVYKNTGKLGIAPLDDHGISKEDAFEDCVDQNGKFVNLSDNLNCVIDYFNLALKMAERTGSAKKKSICHNHLGNCYTNAGQIDEAIKHFELSLISSEDALTDIEKGIIYHNMGRFHAYQGHDDVSGESLKKERKNGSALGKAAEEIFDELDKHPDKKEQEFRKAEIFLKAAENLFSSGEQKDALLDYYLANTYTELGHIYTDRGDFDPAVNESDGIYWKAHDLAGEQNCRQLQYESLCGIVIAHLLAGEIKEASKNVDLAIELYTDSSLKSKTYKAQILNGIIKIKDPTLAEESDKAFECALKYLEDYDSPSLDMLYAKSLAYYGRFVLSSPGKDNRKFKGDAEKAGKAALACARYKLSGIEARMSKLFNLLGERVGDKDFLVRLHS